MSEVDGRFGGGSSRSSLRLVGSFLGNGGMSARKREEGEEGKRTQRKSRPRDTTTITPRLSRTSPLARSKQSSKPVHELICLYAQVSLCADAASEPCVSGILLQVSSTSPQPDTPHCKS